MWLVTLRAVKWSNSSEDLQIIYVCLSDPNQMQHHLCELTHLILLQPIGPVENLLPVILHHIPD